ncbi:MAG: hypothetical protein HOO67_05505 [Candidatus Peribacteraceae bacterium]|nr:hypothetical protein [Candidatus Peribacteraceae bacterium]
MKKLLAVLLIIAQLSADAAEPRRIPVQPVLTIQTSHRPGTNPLAAIIRWEIGHPFDFDCLEFSSQPSGGVWEVIPGPYLKVGNEYVVPIVFTDSPKNRRFYRVFRQNAL